VSFSAILLLGAIFFLFYKGIEIFQESREDLPTFGTRRQQQSAGSSLREWSGKLGSIGLNKWILNRRGYHDKLELLLLRSGSVFGWRPEDLLFYKELGGVLGALYCWNLGTSQPLAWMGAVILGSYLPELYVKGKASARQKEIQRQLPGFVAGIERILAKIKPNALGDELKILIQENRLGTPRKEALQHLAFRTNLPDIQSFTAMVIQSEELGTSLAAVLRNYVEDMRNRRIMRAEEIAGKAPVKLLFPMMVFFFPIVFVIIFGPIALSFINGYK
jgi:tight adherence protein C